MGMLQLRSLYETLAGDTKSAAYIQAIGITDDDYVVVQIHGMGAKYKALLDCARCSEKLHPYIPLPRYKTSKHISGDTFEGWLLLYDIGIMCTAYGLRYVYRFCDLFKNELTWITDKKLGKGSYRIKGRVRERQTFNRVKQTALNYCRILEVKTDNETEKKTDTKRKTGEVQKSDNKSRQREHRKQKSKTTKRAR